MRHVFYNKFFQAKTYTIEIFKEDEEPGNGSDDATLATLTVNPGVLSPIFNPNIVDYAVRVSNEIASIEITATPVNLNATVTDTGNKALNVGDNSFYIIVTAEDKTYTVIVTREGEGGSTVSNDATLKSLTVSSGSLSPAFAASVTDYTVNVPNSATTITITAVANHANATVAGNVTNKALNVGNNPVSITVTAEYGSKKTYKVTVIRGNSVTNVETWHVAVLQIYPNPFTDVVRIEIGEIGKTGELRLRVINAAGTIVHTQMLTSPNETIRLEHLPAGVYFFTIESGKQVKTVKVVKD